MTNILENVFSIAMVLIVYMVYIMRTISGLHLMWAGIPVGRAAVAI